MNQLIKTASGILWGSPTLILIVFSGIFFSASTNLFQIRHLGLWLSKTLFSIFKKNGAHSSDGENGLSPFQVIATSLSATIGTGNIVGVGAAIALGGPGSVFWMWVCSSFSMMTAFFENTLGIMYRKKDRQNNPVGGPMYYIKEGLSKTKRGSAFAIPLAGCFALFTLLSSLGMGNMAQANAISVALRSTVGLPEYASGIILFFILIFVLYGGTKRIGAFCGKLMPLMALFYIFGTGYIVLSNYRAIPQMLSSILKNAFDIGSLAGGFLGVGMKKCIKIGFRRGVFSNEAGLGSSVMVAASSSIKEPCEQGMWGIFQVFFDTVVICSLTAFAILSTSVEAVPLSAALNTPSEKAQYIALDSTPSKSKIMLADGKENRCFELLPSGDIVKGSETSFANVMLLSHENGKSTLKRLEGADLILVAFEASFGKWGNTILSLAIMLFAFSTIIGWSYYGLSSADYLFKGKLKRMFKPVFALAAFVGCVARLDFVFSISDLFNAMMMLCNLPSVLLLSKQVRSELGRYLKKK